MSTTVNRSTEDLLSLLQRSNNEILRLVSFLPNIKNPETLELIKLSTESIVSDLNLIREELNLESFKLGKESIFSQEESWDEDVSFDEDLLNEEIKINKDQVKKESQKRSKEKKTDTLQLYRSYTLEKLQKIAKEMGIEVNFKGSTLPDQQKEKYIKKIRTYESNLKLISTTPKDKLLLLAEKNGIKKTWILSFIEHNSIIDMSFCNFLSHKNLRP